MKRLFDILVSGAGLIVFAPAAALIAIAIKLEDGGPVFFTQDRVGKDCRVFTAFKFRSMIVDAEKLTGAIQATEHDPRMTKVGRLLRSTAFDELPQLWNIFRGDMSVVGPRPLRPGESDTTADGAHLPLSAIPGYEARHRVRPGLTGVAQIYAPRDQLRWTYASSDVCLVSLKPGLAGYIVPSKLYPILAAGRPYIAAVESLSEVAALTERHRCGVVVTPGDAAQLAAEIVRLADQRAEREAMGMRARIAAELFGRERQVAAHALVIEEVASRS